MGGQGVVSTVSNNFLQLLQEHSNGWEKENLQKFLRLDALWQV